MDDFSRRVSRVVRDFKAVRGLTNAVLADRLHVSVASVNAKLNGQRRWTLTDIQYLAQMGVRIPLYIGESA